MLVATGRALEASAVPATGARRAAAGFRAGRRRVALGLALSATAIALLVLLSAALLLGILDGAGPGPAARVVRAGLLRLPASAQAPVSAALGADTPAYAAHPAPGGFRSLNPAQRLAESFTASGASISAGHTRVGLSLAAVGYGSSLTAVGPAAPSSRANRVSYARPGITEWFTNGPLGLEQGFTLTRPPGARAGGPLTLAVRLSGNTRASLGLAGTVLLRRAGDAAFRYDGLSAFDATGRRLRSWLGLDGGRLLIHVDARGARYPLRVDPLVQQGSKLTGSGESGEGDLGWSVALSADGNTALVGAPTDNGSVGAAWVFTRSGTTWTQQGSKLTGSGEVGTQEFGEGVGLSADGNTAIIGGPRGNGVGAAWVFARSGGVWTQQGPKLTAKGESGPGEFGYRVTLSSDGNTALIGAPGDNGEVGAAWVFTRSGTTWSQQSPKLTGAGHVGAGFFGVGLALSADGNTALIGATDDNGATGAAWVFTRAGSTWTEQGPKLTAAGETAEGFFGEGAALSADGNTALIGGDRDNGEIGAAWVFTRTGGVWSQQGGKLTAAGEIGEGRFGQSLALSADGTMAVIGAPRAGAGAGAAWEFRLVSGSWTQVEELSAGGEAGEGLFGGEGNAISLSADGTTALLGGAFDNGGVGATWAYVNSPTVITGSASEVATATAKLNATVNPDGEEVTKCTFEYGPTEGYGSSQACAALPGNGTSAVAVSASLSGLSPDTIYHFRVAAANVHGSNSGEDGTFTTLASSARGETGEATKPAKATSGNLSVEASGGTGAVTIGAYGSEIGGPALAGSSGAYFNVYRSEGSSFTKIEYKDCELDGAKTLWWEDPGKGWAPIPAPTAVFTETPTPCVTVTATESTTPSVAQLSDPRHVGGPAATVESGKCEATKHGNYTEGSCRTVAEKKGQPDHKGKFEWFPSPVGCFAIKHGDYAEGSCLARDESKGKGKGKFEQATNALTGSGGDARLALKGVGTVECTSGSSEEQLRSPLTGESRILLQGCELEGHSCTSTDAAAGTIDGAEAETIPYKEGESVYVDLAGDPALMRFTCASTQYTVTGEVSGETSGDTNQMAATSTTSFEAGKGLQALSTEDGKGSVETTLTWTVAGTGSESSELRTGS